MVTEDDWGTEIGGYDVSRFYTRATDGQGHKESIHVKIPPYIARLMAELVESGAVPAYRTSGDIVRDALVHRLHWLDEQGYLRGSREARTLLRLQVAMQQRLDQEHNHQTYLRQIEQTAATARSLALMGPEGVEQARSMVEQMLEAVAAVDDSPFWRERYRQALEEILKELSRLTRR